MKGIILDFEISREGSSGSQLSIHVVLAADRHINIRSSYKFCFSLLSLPQCKQGLLATELAASCQLHHCICYRYYVEHTAKASPAMFSGSILLLEHAGVV